MAKENPTVVKRIHKDLDEIIINMKKENKITRTLASREIANTIKKLKSEGKKIRREIKF